MSDPSAERLSIYEPEAETGRVSRVAPDGRFLIVNADDFGRNEAVNQGVAEGFRRGIISQRVPGRSRACL